MELQVNWVYLAKIEQMVRLCCFLDKSLTALGSLTEMSTGQGVVSGELKVPDTGHGWYMLKTGSVSIADIYVTIVTIYPRQGQQ